VRIEFIVPKRPTLQEANALIESVRRGEGFCGTGLKAQAFVAPPASYFENAIKNPAPSTMAAQSCWRAHRFDFTVLRCELPKGTAPNKQIPFAGRPKGHVGTLEPRNIKGVNALWGRELMHVSQVLLKQCEHIGSGGVVDFNAHGGFTGYPVSTVY